MNVKFKEHSENLWRLGVTNIFVEKASTQYWHLWKQVASEFGAPMIQRGGLVFYTRKQAAEFYLGIVKSPEATKNLFDGEVKELPHERTKREQPKQLMNFLKELKDL